MKERIKNDINFFFKQYWILYFNQFKLAVKIISINLIASLFKYGYGFFKSVFMHCRTYHFLKTKNYKHHCKSFSK